MKQYTFIQPPRALQKARLDNIAIVPASQLPFKAVWQHVANTLPQGSILLHSTRRCGIGLDKALR